MKPKILVVDDDQSLRKVLEYNLSQEGYQVSSAASGREGLDLIKKEEPELCILDIQLGDISGIEVLEQAKKVLPEMEIIIITAFGTIEMAVEAMKKGAYDYITKPFNREELKLTVKKALRLKELTRENVSLKEELSGRYSFATLVGQGPKIKAAIELAQAAAAQNVTVMLLGESGTGKELVARAIHYASPRKDKPFIPVNAASIPENLLESELFGHVKGSFTGAIKDKAGKFQLAGGGTIFLDEIGDMHPELQAKLLRVLQEKEIDVVGGTKPVAVDVRVITATNKNLEESLRAGRFREDLYYRLNVFPIKLPPLREHQEDIPLLVEHFLKKSGAPPGVHLTPGALEALQQYSWPGNVRELENAIERALIIRKDKAVTAEDFPVLTPVERRDLSKFLAAVPEEGLNLETLERDLIQLALRKTHGNQTHAAKFLGITRHTLLYRMEKYDLKHEE
jgi:two-component system NtrC family response regulator